MKQYYWIVIILFTCINVFSQAKCGYRAVEGASIKANIDSITPLKELILRLEKQWDFVETGKGYWIGYTDDMFSIARHQTTAVPYLKEFIDKTDSLQAKIGALYTMHLIGIRSTIISRWKENFQDSIARKAIISYTNNKELHETVLLLIMRDPWLTDIPDLMEYLSEPTNESANILSALQRYSFNGQPLGQKLPKKTFERKIKVRHKKMGEHLYESYDMQSLIGLKQTLKNKVVIDDEILQSEEWKQFYEYSKSDSLKTIKYKTGYTLIDLTNSTFSYCRFSNRFFYKYEDGIIYIFGHKGARKIWLEWWGNNRDKKITAANNG